MRFAFSTLIVLFCASAICRGASPQRQILICASAKASPLIKQLADDLAAHADGVAVLKGLIDTQGAGPVVRISSEEMLDPKKYDRAAFNHLVIIGLPDADPLLARTWEHYAAIDAVKHTIYAQGWGDLKGDIGYVESDRNPFLHSRRIKSAPFETAIFKISGTSEAGVATAFKAFSGGMLNGLVQTGPLERVRQTILDLDPLNSPPILQLPPSLLLDGKTAAPLIGWTQAPANEYRAYIDVAGAEPTGVWRCKYLQPHALDHTGTTGWMAGFHRMAYGNAVTLAQFMTAEQASATAEKIGAGTGWKKIAPLAGRPAWQADQPADENMPASLGKMTVLSRGNVLILSSLPPQATAGMMEKLK